MVVRLQKLSELESDAASILGLGTEGRSFSDADDKPLQEQTVVEEETVSDTSDPPETTQTLLPRTADRALPATCDRAGSVVDGGYVTDASLDDDVVSECSRKSRRHRGRDRSNTWSHNTSLSLKAAKRSGSLPPMECAMSPAVSRLSLDRGDSPFPASPFPSTPSLSPRKTNRLLVCSEHRMSCSPRLPPIGQISDLHSPRSLPRNTPKELSREVTNIDPALVDNSDPTDVRMMGRRRNALLTQPPSMPEKNT